MYVKLTSNEWREEHGQAVCEGLLRTNSPLGRKRALIVWHGVRSPQSLFAKDEKMIRAILRNATVSSSLP